MIPGASMGEGSNAPNKTQSSCAAARFRHRVRGVPWVSWACLGSCRARLVRRAGLSCWSAIVLLCRA
eukprot:7640427-Pyramimonas_sp.AAC.1